MLIQEVKNHLLDCIIPYWKNLKDEVNGGYFGLVDYNLTVDKTAVKGCIVNSRSLGFFSSAYTLLNDESLLNEAQHAYKFLINYCYDQTNGGVYWSANYDGTVCDSTKHTYNQAFAIYALASYYEASKDEQALKLAFELFDLIETKCTDEVGYLEAFNEKFEPVENDKLSENGIIAEKTMNTLLHVLEAYTELYRVSSRETVKERLKFILNVFETKVYNPELQRQEVFFDKNLNSLIDLHSYGHDIETAWLIDRCWETLKSREWEQRLKPITQALTKKIYECAYREHSLLNECENGIDNTSRIWWVQAEAIVGFMNGYEKDHTKLKYLEAAVDIWGFIKAYVIDPRPNSEWFWEVDEVGVPFSHKPITEPWKCPYHNGRMCFELIRRGIDVTK